MKFTILSLFPDVVDQTLNYSILARAREAGVIEVECLDLRKWATDKHKTVDDTPYGGGPGMVIKVDVVDRALDDIKRRLQVTGYRLQVVLLTPQGRRFTQKIAEDYAKLDHLILIAGHYEGFDERIRLLVDQEISVGDFVLTGGELPAATIVDVVTRLLPETLGDEASSAEESFSLKDSQGKRLLEYPHYTRPELYAPISRPDLGELNVPEVLKSGNHEAIKKWRMEGAKKKTIDRS